MSKTRITLRVVTFMIFTLALSALTQAQATRTWVSGVGDDVNPCSRTAPCKTFAGAISKTAANGEINAIDPGGYGTLTVTKSITVDGAGTMASTLAALTTGFIINDGATATPNTINVILRNLSINGAGNGTDGIRYLAGHTLLVENVSISRFTGQGIEVNTTGISRLMVKDSFISECAQEGIKISSTVLVVAAVDNTRVEKCNQGIEAGPHTRLTVNRSLLDLITAEGINLDDATSNDAVGHVDSTVITSSGTGLRSNGNNTVILRISNTTVAHCTTSLVAAGGSSVSSYGDNKILGNFTNTLPALTSAKS